MYQYYLAKDGVMVSRMDSNGNITPFLYIKICHLVLSGEWRSPD